MPVPTDTPASPSPAAVATRQAALATLAAEPFDMLIVGGGITGAGVAREAALAGFRTALVERDDFASGTSSRSSRLVHGGVRYLEHGHIGLVFESSRERRLLLELAPHLVRPLAFGTLPANIFIHISVLLGITLVAFWLAVALARRRLLS